MGAGIFNKVKKFDLGGLGNIIGGVGNRGVGGLLGDLVGGSTGDKIRQGAQIGGNILDVGSSILGRFLK